MCSARRFNGRQLAAHMLAHCCLAMISGTRFMCDSVEIYRDAVPLISCVEEELAAKK